MEKFHCTRHDCMRKKTKRIVGVTYLPKLYSTLAYKLYVAGQAVLSKIINTIFVYFTDTNQIGITVYYVDNFIALASITRQKTSIFFPCIIFILLIWVGECQVRGWFRWTSCRVNVLPIHERDEQPTHLAMVLMKSSETTHLYFGASSWSSPPT